MNWFGAFIGGFAGMLVAVGVVAHFGIGGSSEIMILFGMSCLGVFTGES